MNKRKIGSNEYVSDVLGPRGLLLWSYETPVAMYLDGRMYRTQQFHSVTTSRHINSWVSRYDLVYERPQEWFDAWGRGEDPGALVKDVPTWVGGMVVLIQEPDGRSILEHEREFVKALMALDFVKEVGGNDRVPAVVLYNHVIPVTVSVPDPVDDLNAYANYVTQQVARVWEKYATEY